MITVASMVERNAFRCYSDARESAATGELHLMTIGQYEGHPSGPFKITRETYAQVLAEFERRPHPLYVDYNHDEREAAGWVHGLEVRGDELWATKVQWTPRARAMLDGDEYRYCSPMFVTEGYTDTITGEKRGAALINVALTNDPFFEAQHALKLSRAAAQSQEIDPMQEQVMTALSAIAESAGMDVAALIERLPEIADKIAALLSTPDAESEPAAAEAAPEAPSDAPDEDADDDEDEKKKMQAEIDAGKAAVSALSAERDAVRAQLDALITEHATAVAASRKALIDRAVREGRMFDSDRADGQKILADGGEELFARVYAHRKVPIGQSQAGRDPNAGAPVVVPDDGDEGEQVAAAALFACGRAADKADALKKIIAQRKRG